MENRAGKRFGRCYPLLREFLPILLCPVAIGWHGLQRRTALRTAGARALHFGFGHARTGPRLQAGTDVNDLALALVLRRLSTVAHTDERQRKQQGKNGSAESNSASHVYVPRESVPTKRVTLESGWDNIHLTGLCYDHSGSRGSESRHRGSSHSVWVAERWSAEFSQRSIGVNIRQYYT